MDIGQAWCIIALWEGPGCEGRVWTWMRLHDLGSDSLPTGLKQARSWPGRTQGGGGF